MDKQQKRLLIRQVILFLICAGLSFYIIHINYFFITSDALYHPVESIDLARTDFVWSGELPRSRSEMLERYPELQPLEFYGKWCYFYRPEENDFYLVAHYSGNWFIYDKSGKREMRKEPYKSMKRQLIDRCEREK